MAYDPKDPKDKAIVDGLIAEALAEQADEHETNVTGLKAKVTELRGKLSKAKTGGDGEDNSAEVERLEAELTTVRGELKTVNKTLGNLTKERDTLATERDGLNTNLKTVLVDQGLTSALTEVGVDPKYMNAVKALLGPQVSLKDNGGKSEAFAGDKALGVFVKEWSQGDEGKSYISAAGNSGGGAGGSQGGANGGKNTWTRDQYEAADSGARATFFAAGGTLTEPS